MISQDVYTEVIVLESTWDSSATALIIVIPPGFTLWFLEEMISRG